MPPSIPLLRHFLIIISIFACGPMHAGDDDGNLDGKSLFENNCIVCHAWDKEIVGPALGSIQKKRDESWLYDFIKSSQTMIGNGDAHAVFLFAQYKHNVMPDFDELSNDQILAIVRYLQQKSEKSSPFLSVEEESYALIADPTAIRGRQLFEGQCVGCHQLRSEVYGPALVSVSKTRPKEWLHRFIRNSAKMISENDPYAVFIYEKYDKKRMYAFEHLDSADINDILYYIQVASASPNHVQGATAYITNKTTPEISFAPPKKASQGNMTLFLKILVYGVCLTILGGLAFGLYKMGTSMGYEH